MQRIHFISATTMLSFALAAGSASAAIVVDGSYDADYGAPKSTVLYDPTAPESNFGSPTNFSDTTAYSIYLADQGGVYYGFLKSTTTTGLSFANLYFDLDPQNGNGSDLVIEVTNGRAANPNNGIYGAVPGIQFVVSGDGTGIEFSVPNSVFTAAIPGVVYEDGQTFATDGGTVALRLSQAFGYSVAGGSTYGPDRLGAVTLVGTSVVPEPETVTLLALGMAALALTRRRTLRRKG